MLPALKELMPLVGKEGCGSKKYIVTKVYKYQGFNE